MEIARANCKDMTAKLEYPVLIEPLAPEDGGGFVATAPVRSTAAVCGSRSVTGPDKVSERVSSVASIVSHMLGAVCASHTMTAE